MGFSLGGGQDHLARPVSDLGSTENGGGRLWNLDKTAFGRILSANFPLAEKLLSSLHESF